MTIEALAGRLRAAAKTVPVADLPRLAGLLWEVQALVVARLATSGQSVANTQDRNDGGGRS